MKTTTAPLFKEKEMDSMIANIANSLLSDLPKAELKDIAFIGIQVRGVPLAHRIAAEIFRKTKINPPVAMLDISMYRDDLGISKTLPHIHITDVPFDLDEKTIILVDDVLHTGRTIRAALDAITDYGRPDYIRLAVLIDRGDQEFPIKADYVGETVKVPSDKLVSVLCIETDDKNGVYILPGKVGEGELIK
jgi:pyrimidine operon attenuation protein / uracil phosphoribosyltransferase